MLIILKLPKGTEYKIRIYYFGGPKPPPEYKLTS